MALEKSIDVLGIGNAIIDVIADAEDAFLSKHNLNKGSMTLVDEETSSTIYSSMQNKMQMSGGSAANTIFGLSQLGCKSAFIGKRSDDELGNIFYSDLTKSKIIFTTNPLKTGESSARCLIMVTSDAERTMATFLGSSSKLTLDDINEDLVASSKIVYLEGYLFDPPEAQEAFIEAAEFAKKHKTKVSFTLSDAFCVERHRKKMRTFVQNNVDILFCNEGEVKALYETESIDEAINILENEVEIGVITKGENGAVIIEKNLAHEIEAFVTNVVDTTGAGDFFAAGFLAGISKNYDLVKSGLLGAACSSEIISHYGGRPEKGLKEFIKNKAGLNI
jgi:sugar/nucleoside kinase (ribokinase family)